MKKIVVQRILFFVVLFAFMIGFLYTFGCFGTPTSRLEADVRASRHLDEEWIVDGSVGDRMAAFICYAPDQSDYTTSVYIKQKYPGLSFGYFPSYNGGLFGLDGKTIMEFTIKQSNEKAYLSMNEQNVVKMEFEAAGGLQEVEIDPDKPFALVLPADAGCATFYDGAGQSIAYGSRPVQ